MNPDALDALQYLNEIFSPSEVFLGKKLLYPYYVKNEPDFNTIEITTTVFVGPTARYFETVSLFTIGPNWRQSARESLKAHEESAKNWMAAHGA